MLPKETHCELHIVRPIRSSQADGTGCWRALEMMMCGLEREKVIRQSACLYPTQ